MDGWKDGWTDGWMTCNFYILFRSISGYIKTVMMKDCAMESCLGLERCPVGIETETA